MKTLYKQTLGIVFIVTCLLCGIIPATAQQEILTDFITVNGLVRDKDSKKKLEYVNVSIPGTNIGTITNTEGEFTIKVPTTHKTSTVEVSHIGYLSTQIPVNGTNLSELTVYLTPNSNILDEVVIRARDPRFLVEEALNKVPENYSAKHNMLTGFYRETAQKGRRYINISEAIIDIYKTPYSREIDQDRVQIYKGRKLLSQKRGDTLVVKLLGGPNLSIFLDVVKNPDILLDKETLSHYAFRMEEPVMIDNRAQYVISFQPQVIMPYALYYGKLYIDKDKLAFTRAEFKLSMDDINKATQAILKKKPFGLRFKPTEVSFLVNYKEINDKTYLSYIRNEVKFKCDWKRRLFSTNYTIMSEMVVTDMKEENVTNIPYKVSFKSSQSLSDKVTDFADEDFWGNYNIIEPTESLESAVSKLRKQKR
ncbi:carboxypeptidase-like regulatory domain-containing protein [Massilibacteroides vaginae]|uniref:carboxypeptidase-like regulatory domain-containing protein n=1 Tax=Massilibacteroides vaginae TaxID=1673718 RepID=UPI000A1C9DC4|nr:carboxypeptidase-like regulatory domain-containing protein [Massilibacteroides vaginae]